MNSAAKWRLLDTGPMSAAENIAFDSVLLDMRSREEIPSTIRFLQFTPQAALIGRHQTISREIREDYCRRAGIDISRRLTGGGAVFFDPTQLGWEVIASRDEFSGAAKLSDLTEKICQGLISGLGLLGIEACFRPRNDVEVSGRKISGTGGAYEGNAFLLQGTLLVDFDVEAMIRALRVPTEKLSARELDSARHRVTCLAQLMPRLPSLREIKHSLALGFIRSLGIELETAEPAAAELALLDERLSYYRSDEWTGQISEPPDSHQVLRSMYRGKGGLVRSAVSVDLKRRRIRSALFTGDFFISPARTVLDLEASLKETGFDDAEAHVRNFFSKNRAEALHLGAGDFWMSLKGCLDKLDYVDHGIGVKQANYVTVIGSAPLPEAAAGAEVLLLPYCAQKPDCGCRGQDACDMCEDCTVGRAYSMAAGRGMAVVTVRNYEHLAAVFAACRNAGVTSFIGCCCHSFLARRHRAFSESGLEGVIVGIEDTTCYDLGLEESAYRGDFDNQTNLRLELLEKVLSLVSGRSRPLILNVPAGEPQASRK